MAGPSEDEKHLRYLAIGHYFVAATHLFICLIPVMLIVTMAAIPPVEGEEVPLPYFQYFMYAITAGLILFYAGMAAATLLGGRWLAARRRRTACIVVAALNCMLPPMGVALGALTLLVLQRESVQRMFEPAPVTGSTTPASSPSAASG